MNDEAWLRIAENVARHATCIRRNVGCVLVNARNHLLAIGYNDVAPGMPVCNEVVKRPLYGPEHVVEWNRESFTQQECIGYEDTNPYICAGALLPSGTGLGACNAIHAEINALLLCKDVWDIETCYVTCSPCRECIKPIMNTSCRRIVFREAYAHMDVKNTWLNRNGDYEWIQI